MISRPLSAQIDPDKRELVQVGFEQGLEGAQPLQAYGYYYLNEPDFFHTNVTLRLALAPVYLDSEIGFVGLLGPQTDLGIGLAGGGFADSYYEFLDGKYYPDQSFYGHDAEGSVTLYHRFNPNQRIPLNGLIRLQEHYSVYENDGETAPNFVLPKDHATEAWRVGLRYGGREPLLAPDLAMELSAWYAGQYRNSYGPYGFDGDRVLNADSHLFWARALLIYTMPSKQSFDVNLTVGTSVNADRFSAYRLGGDLSMISEFPLLIPGYFEEELSARNFMDFTARYTFPLDPGKIWSIGPVASVAEVDYVPGQEQPRNFNSGAGVGLGFRSRSGTWRALASYGYGFEAIRDGGRGGQSISIMMEINLDAKNRNRPTELDHVTGFLLNHL